MHRYLLALFSSLFLLAGCGSMSHKTYIDRAEAAIADRNWTTAYRFLEDGFVTENVLNRTRALALVKTYPALLTGGAETFSIPNLVRSIDSNGLVAGPKHELDRLAMYKVVASPEAVALAEQNIAKAFAQVKDSRGLSDRENAEARAIAERFAAEEKVRQDQNNVEIAKRRAGIVGRMAIAKEEAMVYCKDTLECSKVFALAQIFIVDNATMKIQTSNETIIETFNPNEGRAIGARATKFPRQGTSAVVALSLTCGKTKYEHELDVCMEDVTRVYTGFVPYIKKMLIK